ncbi:MAG TPA: hypothetical protein VNX28_10500, partial [Gemmataceae bacterium]|nr:hypothetical protein [Gemmataceae bacterium]
TFSPDGKSLAGGLRDGTILIWEMGEAYRKLALSPKLSSKQLESLWTDLLVDNAGTAHQALWTLAAAPKHSVAFLQGRLKAVAPFADAGKIQQWIAEQDSENFAVRQGAAKELEKGGEQVRAPIRKALKDKLSLEAQLRLGQILKTILDVPGPETVRTIRAIMVLERVGSPEAQGILDTLARGAPGARETEEAKESLERMHQRAGGMP